MSDMQRIYAKLGERIAHERVKRGMTQQEFCNFLLPEIKLLRTSITKIELGQQRFMLHDLVTICEKLGLVLDLTLKEK